MSASGNVELLKSDKRLSVRNSLVARRSELSEASHSHAEQGQGSAAANDDDDDEEPLSFGDLQRLALIPASVPALVLLLALGIAAGIGPLPTSLRNLFEQIAAGALLITYLKEIFPQVMERLDAVVETFGPTTTATRSAKHKKWFGVVLVVIVSTLVSVAIQAGAEGWPGLRAASSLSSNANLTTISCSAPGGLCITKAGRSADPRGGSGGGFIGFTPGDTVPYFLGFFVDGVALAYDDNKIECNRKLVKRLILSGVFAVDNFLDGFGLAPVLRDAFGDGWWLIMVLFSLCVYLGAFCTALLRHTLPDESFHGKMVHLVWYSIATLSILDGGMELAPHGLSLFVSLGMAITWLFLFLGDAADDDDEDEAE